MYKRSTGGVQEVYRRYAGGVQEVYSRYSAGIQEVYRRYAGGEQGVCGKGTRGMQGVYKGVQRVSITMCMILYNVYRLLNGRCAGVQNVYKRYTVGVQWVNMRFFRSCFGALPEMYR